ncbi:MAG: NFACT RNA binding domain-containing protein [Bacteroidetes bacterium]|jgi:predicted ribosome quality control (RQC) complex YloA/Tae2 family protein|nr:NFACT RNA binding domain-containing protein [Bacteroidota bacterium]
MISNYYTLAHLVSEWRSRLHDAALAQPFTQSRFELVLPFEPVLPGNASGRFAAVINCTPAQNVLFFKDTYPRARRNSTGIFAGLEGALVNDIAMHPSDRQIRLSLRTGSSIVLQFFGPKANALLVGPDGTVTDAFLRSKAPSAGGQVSWKPDPPSIPDETAFASMIRADLSSALLQALKRAVPSFGPVLLREVMVRAGVDGRERVAELDELTMARVAREAIAVHRTLTGPARPRIYYRDEIAVAFAPAPLVHLSELRSEEFSSVSDGVRTFVGSAHRRADLGRIIERLHADLSHAAEQATTTLQRIEQETPNPTEADRAERYARLLQANLSELRKGMREAIVEDLFSDGREIIAIPLDPHLTPAKNAERLFDRARKVRTTVVEQGERCVSLQTRVRSLATIIDELDGLTGEDDLAALIERHAATLRSAGIRIGEGPASKEDDRPPFRIFTVDGGFRVWAGKSGENNDLLSTRHTAKNDLWFHVRGMSGSHVVLKMGTGRGEVSRRAKEQAAAIAAYYSKMKKARHVPVIMCEGKYVRKPKGATAGTVTVERETVLFVDPALPGGADEGS